MSKTDDTFESAFPHNFVDQTGQQIISFGMALRDYFAAKALNGMLSNPKAFESIQATKNYANYAYTMADAMLAERDK